MKVIHTYVDNQAIIWKELLYVQYLSAILAKKHYGNISFYGDNKVCQQVKVLGLPYDEIISDVVNKSDVHTFSIPKLKVYEKQTKPFLHIDTDTLIFDKIEFDTFGEDYLFSHLDIWMDEKLSSEEGIEELFETYLIKSIEHLSPKSILEAIKQRHDYTSMNDTYSELFFKLLKKIEKKLFSNINFRSIPNMNIVYVKNFNNFAKASSLALNHYYNNKEEIDKHKNGPCYIEQFMLHSYLRNIDEKYKKSNKNDNHVIFNEQPLREVIQIDDVNDRYGLGSSFETIKQKDYNLFDKDGNRLITKFSKYNNWNIMKDDEKYEKFFLSSEQSIKNLFQYDFGGFLHLTFLKWKTSFQAMVIHRLRKEIGDEGIRKIHKYFETKYVSQSDLESKSEGEKLYTKITGFDFNPKKEENKSVL